MSRSRWCAGRPSLRFEVDTGPVAHHISWVEGSLVLHDHDVEAERVLQALGGEPCVCLSVLDACRESPVEVVRGGWRRQMYRTVPAPGQVPSQAALAQFTSSPHFAKLPRAQQARLLGAVRWQHLQTQVPEAMLEVLEAAREVRRTRQAPRPPAAPDRSAEARLQAAVAPACEEGMRRSRRDLSPYATITVECWKRGRDEEPLLNGSLDRAGGALALSLPVSWLNRVWVRGLAVVDGHFVLEVDRPAPARELEATVIRWERRLAGRSTASAAPCRLRSIGDGWTLSW